jgi:CRISPR system Cascade subunit CasD
MITLLLRLAAPIQAWGAENKFERRGTMREPTKSGVIGLLAAALGRRRNESLEDLSQLRFGVRLDQPGQLLRDYHTVHGETDKHSYVTERYYLADAIFLVGVEGEEALLNILDKALHSPVFPLYLGRRSCPPVEPVSLGIRKKTLSEALREEPWQASLWYCKRAPKNFHMTLVLDAEQPGTIRRRDIPLSFAQTHRQHAFRYIDDQVDVVAADICGANILKTTDHDPFVEWGD